MKETLGRLKSEHRRFESKIAEVQCNINNNNILDATEIIYMAMADRVIHHAVEEEAKLMRVIMQKAKDESPESIRIMQEHTWVMNFLKTNLEQLKIGPILKLFLRHKMIMLIKMNNQRKN